MEDMAEPEIQPNLNDSLDTSVSANTDTPNTSEPVPKIVFIVPYRDREQQQIFFAKQMATVLSDMNPTDYKIYYIHQCDTREFNRGAMKNIGFIMLKEKYPNDYQNITLVLNDVDTMPYSKGFINYDTTPGNVKHFYGFRFTLGGIVSINAGDFEKINGFPNFWAWGYEDNMLQYRVESSNGMQIDRSQFYPYMDKNIMQMKDDIYRSVNRTDFNRYQENTQEGIDSITNLQYMIDESTGFVNVTQFYTGREENPDTKKIHDLRNGSQPYKLDKRKKKTIPQNMINMLISPISRQSNMKMPYELTPGQKQSIPQYNPIQPIGVKPTTRSTNNRFNMNYKYMSDN